MSKKKINFLILVLITLTFSSCSSGKSLSNGKKIDNQLVGVWEGLEIDKQVIGLKKEWEMTRNNDGTFVLKFRTIYGGVTDEIVEKGNWWTKGNKFFEYHEDSEKTDTYKYTVLNKDQIQFEMINTDVEFKDSNYTFIDTRISSQKNKKSTNDGLTIENARKVKSIAEEYEYIKENCDNCELLGQALIQHNGKPYDELVVKKADGKEVSYYFDISSFFGKW